ncbi:unnamed protein product [Parnassius mnemosyne]|uniref:Uncharacterized protein n=1 Tax=Parnassius mnemosyne TaxID=213953 RepID=A0AAV1LKX6_9NEOP
MEPKLANANDMKTYLNCRKKSLQHFKDNKSGGLTTKDAVQFLLQGTLKRKVCRFCLSITTSLSELDEILEVASLGALYQVTIRDMIASFYPFQVSDDPNFPSKICTKCLDKTISSYLFTQQCERAERALRNYFNDINEKFEKLDPLERVKKRGRRKLNPNFNMLYVDYKKVMSYADPIINIVNIGASLEENEDEMEISELECPRCWLVLPNIESLINHEKIHPKSMWYNCRLCGKSFVKYSQYKNHKKQIHISGKKSDTNITKKEFKCNECGLVSEDVGKHLQHIEKHKFKQVIEHLIERKMNDLCTVCMEKGEKMMELNETLHFHAGYPELTGEKSLATILTATIPEMNTVHDNTGTKICETCLNHALASYIFVNKIKYTRDRLQTCISLMLENLKEVGNSDNYRHIMVEISADTILPLMVKEEPVEDVFQSEDCDIDESKLKVEVLEDEFRIESESSDDDSSKFEDFSIEEENIKRSDNLKNTHYPFSANTNLFFDNPARDATKKYFNKKLVNGYQIKGTNSHNLKNTPVDNICSEFLTFKMKPKPLKRRKPKFTCPFCGKHFISDYFLKKHVLKHINMKINCHLCSKQFKSKFYLFEHIKMVHIANDKSYSVCKICGRSFADLKMLLKHKKTHETKECLLCDKLFSSQKRFDSHLQRHAVKFNMVKKLKVQICSFCEKECSNGNELSLHVNKSHLQIKPYSCDMCEKQFYTEYNLSCHKKVHSSYSKETCEFCKKVFKCRKDLVIHLRKHIGTKPHHCQVCQQSFYSDKGLNSHMRRTHGGRFCCRLCKLIFNNKMDLKTHVNVTHNVI